MVFSNDRLVKIIPTVFDNRESEKPVACYVNKLTGREVKDYSESLKDIKSDAELFCLIVKKVENFYLQDANGEIKELTTPEEVVDIPGIHPLLSEVVSEFGDVNMFTGKQKN